MFHLRNNLLL